MKPDGYISASLIICAVIVFTTGPAAAEQYSIGERGMPDRGNFERGVPDRGAVNRIPAERGLSNGGPVNRLPAERNIPERATVNRFPAERGVPNGGPVGRVNPVNPSVERVLQNNVRPAERALPRYEPRRDAEYYKERGYVLDKRYRHNHYYPPRGRVIDTVPHNHHVIWHHGMNFYYHAGIWYRPYGVRFIIVHPPVGVIVPFLPPYYTTLWIGGLPYYYADHVYYTWSDEATGYVVVEPPDDAEISILPAKPEQLFIYPKKGQSEQQQSNDRYQCHRWSADQTGFDPTQPGGSVPAGEHVSKRNDYQRAMKACLEARNYSVQ